MDFRLDAGTAPKEITLRQGTNEMKGIYALDGDTLRVCVAAMNDPRPKAFKSEKDSRLMLMVLKREKR
jgi:uncharacterized protein (TIGR03067 family)